MTQTCLAENLSCPASFAFSLPEVLRRTQAREYPFTHWCFDNVLPPPVCEALTAWNPGDWAVAGDVGGRRETRNANRVFINEKIRRCDDRLNWLAEHFNASPMRQAFENICQVVLDKATLRLELCLDKNGFWLEPHTDIGAKKLTLLISLSEGKNAHEWGTDLMTPDGKPVIRASGRFNSGILFVPSRQTWHGFIRRPIQGLRRTLIVNFVDETWRAVHELAFDPQIS